MKRRWPFGQKALIRRAFSKYLSEDVIEKLVDDPTGSKLPLPVKVTVKFTIFQVRDNGSADDAVRLLERALPVARAYGGTIEAVMSSIVFASSIPGPFDQVRFVAALSAALGDDVRQVSGERLALRGLTVSEIRTVHGTWFSDFSDVMQRLISAPYGASIAV